MSTEGEIDDEEARALFAIVACAGSRRRRSPAARCRRPCQDVLAGRDARLLPRSGRLVPRLRAGQARGRGNKVAPIWAFTNGDEGQRNIIDTVPAAADYTPLWAVRMVTWQSVADARVLRSAAAVRGRARAGDVTITGDADRRELSRPLAATGERPRRPDDDEAVPLERADGLAVEVVERCGRSATRRSVVARRWRNEPSNGPCRRAGSSRVPRDGQRSASGQASQRGTRAMQTVAPRSMSACADAAVNGCTAFAAGRARR